MKVTTHMLGSRRIGQFVDLKPLDTNATVKEAIDKGDVYVNDVLTKSDLTLEWLRTTSRFSAAQGAFSAASGATVKIVLHIDPAKTAYDPEDVSAETTAV